MSSRECDQLREVAPELALGVLGGAERAEALIHLGDCSRCQAYVAELTEAADAIPLVVGEREPPPGFETRVLDRLDSGRRRSRRRGLALVAAVAAAAAIVSITIVRVIDADAPIAAPTTVDAEAPPTMMQARMVSDQSGAPVGWAYVSGRRAVALSVSYGLPGGAYAIEVRPEHGEPVVIGDMTYAGERGSWAGISKVDIDAQSDIALVADGGQTVCHGNVDVVE